MNSKLGYNQLDQMQIQIPKSNDTHPQQYDVLEEQPQNIVQYSPNQLQQTKKLQDKDNPHYKSFKQLLLIMLNIGLSSFYFGYILAYLSAVDFDTIMVKYSIGMKKQVAEGLLIGCMPIGGGIGALCSKFLIERFQRSKCIMIVNKIAFVTGILLFIPKMETLFIVRILQGVCSGFFSCLAPLLMKQIAPKQISGILTSCHQIMIASGIFFAFAFSMIVEKIFNDPTNEHTWWIIFAFPLVTIIFQSYVMTNIFNIESPKYLLLQSNDDKARQMLRKIYKEQYIELVVQQILSDIGRIDQKESIQIAGEYVAGNPTNNSFSKVNISTPRAAVIVAIHLAALQQFCGINAIMAYGGQIVGEDLPQLKLALPIFINAEQVIAAIFSSYLVTKFGRKELLQYGCIGAALTCIVVAMGFYIKGQNQGLGLTLIVMGLILFMANFGLTLGPVVWVYLPQIVQADILPVATGVNWGTSAFIMLFFPVIKQSLPDKNPFSLFVFFAFWCVVSYFFNQKYLIQTKGKTQKQIIEEYRKESSFC